MDTLIVEVERTRKAAQASPVDSINSDVPTVLDALTPLSSATTETIAVITLTRLLAVSTRIASPISIISNDSLFVFFFRQTFRHVTVANFAVPMHSAYPPISIAMDITTALTRVTRQIARQSLVPTTNFSAPTVGRTERQNVSRNRSSATENVTAKMGRTKRQLARRLRVPLWVVSINVDRRLPEGNVTVLQDELFRAITEHALISTSVSSGDIAISFARTQTDRSPVSALLATR